MGGLLEAARTMMAAPKDDGSPVRSASITIGDKGGLIEVDGNGFIVNKDVNLVLP